MNNEETANAQVLGGLLATWDRTETLKGDGFVARAINSDRPRTVAGIHEGRKLAGAVPLSGDDKEVTGPWSTPEPSWRPPPARSGRRRCRCRGQ